MGLWVGAVEFGEESVSFSYVDPDDIRVDGAVVVQRTLMVKGSHPQFFQALDGLRELAQEVLADVLEDWSASVPFVPDDTGDGDDEDEDEGMGD